MKQFSPFTKYTDQYDQWYEKYPEVFQSELSAIKQQMQKLPTDIHGIEVGLGTGRFATALGIKEGIEPVLNMAKVASNRGVEVMEGTAENLPYRSIHFDFVLFVTICHLDDLQVAFKEAYRVLKKGASVIVGFIDKDQAVAKSYEAKRKESKFYKNARFYSVKQVEEMLNKTGFRHFEYVQTLFGELDKIDTLQSSKEGFGEGSFVVVKAVRKS